MPDKGDDGGPRSTFRGSRGLRIAIQVLILTVILLALGTVGFIEYSAQPAFCTNCHNMMPYYESWATSSHSEVPCIRCHYAPGIKAEAMGKLQAANQVVKYVTGAYGTKPWAEIEDAACLRSGCHAYRKLQGELDFNGVPFDHEHHLTELRRGKQLRCTSCHSQIVQGEHVAVTRETCILCHFRDQPAGQPIAGCTGCHRMPPRLVSEEGFVVDHPQYVQDLVSCISCHEQVAQGSGSADQGRCFSCHNEPERLEQYDNTTLIHQVHIAGHNLECALCHTTIEHRVVEHTSTFELDCASCHRRAHEAQQRMYTGSGGHGTESMPSSMYLARVSCQSCHGLASDVAGHAEIMEAGEATCLSCHGVRYANILPGWQEEVERKLALVAPVVAAARSRPGRASAAARAQADSLLQLAAENVELVRVGRGAHNVAYADELLRAALEFVNRAVLLGQSEYRVPDVGLGEPVSGSSCLNCHLGVDRQRGTFRGLEFDHRPHVTTARLPCTSCHADLDQHGESVLASAADCAACHHSGAVTCERCHAGARGAPERAIATAAGEFRHPVHAAAGLGCTACHGSGFQAARVECEVCHESHHQPQAACSSCHGAGLKDKHAGFGHEGCTVCHGDNVSGITTWSRKVCSTCHTDRTDHYPDADCHVCHQVPPL